MSRADTAAIVPAAGKGKRFGGRVRKPYVLLDGWPVLVQTLRALDACSSIRWIVPVVEPGAASRVQRLLARAGIRKALPLCVGGASRTESVARGFAQVPKAARWVLVHDGARPCVTSTLIEQAIQAARRFGAVACGLPSAVTVKAADDRHTVRLTLDRERLWLMQTPQVFRRDWFAQALSQADHRLSEFPDDAALFESAGYSVRLIPGDPLNLKVTTKDDLLLAEAILQRRSRGQKSDDRSQKKLLASLV